LYYERGTARLAAGLRGGLVLETNFSQLLKFPVTGADREEIFIAVCAVCAAETTKHGKEAAA
jgi:hypothetical protein